MVLGDEGESRGREGGWAYGFGVRWGWGCVCHEGGEADAGESSGESHIGGWSGRNGLMLVCVDVDVLTCCDVDLMNLGNA